jgi:monofunctional glycosyltransferase
MFLAFWLLKWLVRIFLTSIVLSLLVVLVFRFVPIPVTMFMVVRGWEAQAAGDHIRVEKQWVGIEDISRNLQHAVIVSEDRQFYRHSGFDFDAIQGARQHNRVSKQKMGASTLTQQLAKNLFLWPDRSWLRKGLEAYFTVVLEVLWSKQRILEAYLNVVEMGQGVYGAEAASHLFRQACLGSHLS